MKYYDNNVHLVESLQELPALYNSNRVYLDFETSSGDSSLMSINPWHNCTIAGVCITVDNVPNAWYIPVGHVIDSHRNLPKKEVLQWVSAILATSNMWVNQNPKYDAHCLENEGGSIHDIKLVDTITLAKLVDSDMQYKGGYNLENLVEKWLKYDIRKFKKALDPYLYRENGDYYNKDYGRIPVDVLGPYGGQDVLSTRDLRNFIDANIPAESRRVAGIECEVTNILYGMERLGVRVDMQQVQIKQLQTLCRMVQISEELESILGRKFEPSSSPQVTDLMLNVFGLPVLYWNEKGNPSFDKASLQEYSDWIPYMDRPDRDTLTKCIALIKEFRECTTFNGLFLQGWQDLHTNGVLHGDVNQTVRTGRMSMKRPNGQQLNYKAKKLIVPWEDSYLVDIDYSSIEFRTITHFMQQKDLLRGYQVDPDMDCHNMVASMMGVQRRRAKTLNFAIGYGTGKKGMAKKMDLMHDLREVSNGNRELFDSLCAHRGEDLYNLYHETFPEMKSTANRYMYECIRNGYVTNLYGRRRHLPERQAYRAFNTANQSSAADIMKERMAACNQYCRNYYPDIKPLLCVHDSILFKWPKQDFNQQVVSNVVNVLEHPNCNISVPIRCSIGWSDTSWAYCNQEWKVPL